MHRVVADIRDLDIWLRHLSEAYGGDLPVRAPGQLRLAPAFKEPAVARPDEFVAEVGTVDAVAAPARDANASPPQPAADDTPAPVAAVPAEAALAALRAHIGDCTRCKLCRTRKNVVFGEGDPRARVLFIGEAPGFHEDQQARPFVGAAGQLLDRIIENGMGLRREQVFIANVNKCRPPDNREPEPDEVAACLPFLREQVRIIRPEVIVCLGRVATSNLLGTTLPMRAMRGRDLTYEGTRVVVTWHPAYLLRTPAAKAETWEDIKRVNRLLGQPERPARPGQSGPTGRRDPASDAHA